MFVIHFTVTILVGQFTKVIKPECSFTLMLRVAKVSGNACHLMPQFFTDLYCEWVSESQWELGDISIGWQERIDHVVRRKHVIQIASSIGSCSL
jgi:hypothetical protein